jgi:hypothetical protein
LDTPKGFNIHPKIHKTAQDQIYFGNPLPWRRRHKSRAESRQTQRPRWARGRPDGPTWKPLKLRFGMEVKHNSITCFQPTLPAVTARTDLGRAINRGTIHHSTHTIGAFLFYLYFLE